MAVVQASPFGVSVQKRSLIMAISSPSRQGAGAIVNGDVKARINGAGFDPLIAAGASKIGLDLRASMRAWL